jgi:hypothetical protein
MTVLGLRCSNRGYSYAILRGKNKTPILVDSAAVSFPKGFKSPQSLKWFYQEIQGLIHHHGIKKIVIKRFEGRPRGSAYETRVEHEAAATLAGADAGITAIFKKVKSTIAKDLGLKGRPKYLASVDNSMMPDLDNKPEEIREAVLCARSELS